jgi:hypothetical protein
MPNDLSTHDVPLSPVFINFVTRWLDRDWTSAEKWHDQLSEELSNANRRMAHAAGFALAKITTDPIGEQAIEKAYSWFHALATGNMRPLRRLHSRFDFIAIVGIPRNGGSYLTTELFSALGYSPTSVPAAIAHDGVPDARPFRLKRRANSWIDSLMSMSEYLTMLELFFEPTEHRARTIVPKKLTKAVYAGPLFRTVLGPRAEYFVTVRHPISSCVSTYEKSGGLPIDGKIKTRSAMEQWIARDLVLTGVTPSELQQLSYFTAYVRYWEQFHINLAMSGLLAHQKLHIVPYGKDSMEGTAQSFHQRFDNHQAPANFVATEGKDGLHQDWVARSEEAINRVYNAWKLVGLQFPVESLRGCA